MTHGRVDIDGAALLGERAAFTGRSRAGAVSVGGYCHLLPTADGWAAVSCARIDDRLLYGALVQDALPANPWPALADWLKRHPGEVLAERAEMLGVPAYPVRIRNPPAAPSILPPRSVEGLLVVDFSALWAGPLCAHLLGLAGARVVKVETPSRPDGARRGNNDFYQLLHAGQRSVVLDPASVREQAALTQLVAAADIVIESSRPRALAGWGLDAHAAVAAGTTWVSITAAGRCSNRVGFGDDIAAAAGLIALSEENVPVFCGDALADPLAGLTAAARALTAPADGSGVLWDISMTDVVAQTLDGTPSKPAIRTDTGWAVETSAGVIPTAAPRRRAVGGTASATGAETVEVLREIGIVC